MFPSLEFFVIDKIRTKLLSASNNNLLNEVNDTLSESLKNKIFSDETFLHHAVRKGELELIEQCLEYLPTPNPKSRMDGTNTIFHLAIASGNPKVLELLLNKIVDFELNSTDRYGNTVYHDAANHQNPTFLKLLLTKNPDFDLTCRNIYSNSVLQFIHYNHNSLIFQALLDHSTNFDPNKINSKLLGKTSSFHEAVLSKNPELLKLLLDKYAEFDPYTKDVFGYTVFHIAADQNDQDCLTILLDKYPQFNLKTMAINQATVYSLSNGNKEAKQVIKNTESKNSSAESLNTVSLSSWAEKLKAPLATLKGNHNKKKEKDAPDNEQSIEKTKGKTPKRGPK